MAKDPWTDPDPQPEDFNEFLRTVDRSEVEVHEGNPHAKLTIVSEGTGEDAERIERIALESDPPLYEVLADLRRGRERRGEGKPPPKPQPQSKHRAKRARGVAKP
jgi:hypothetical protein